MIGDLFDFSFTRFITLRVARVFYAVALGGSFLAFVALVLAGLSGWIDAQNQINALLVTASPVYELQRASTQRSLSILMLVAAPFAAAGSALLSRLVAEFVVVVFSIAESLRANPSAAPSRAPQTPPDP
jgi:hypothetical protein